MSTTLEMRRRAARLYRSPRFRQAYVDGALAARDGRHADTCPYERDGRKTWRQVYRVAWLRGHGSENGDPLEQRG